ncbi:uncharacterized protein LOC131677452 [Topomyia yanbarensis]|uniref:uncharacterized protein LOC131677452 n=1 Tax=Topomyia yanbarensis TaxID=2498891 RepID=UPI00273AEA94|nr:uncharacterized protein LOC131677452 [Topomyia yanbarensis]
MANLSRDGRISDQIMNYYLRYGQNRDLEKFLRLRASTTRSSSDGSLPALDELDRRGEIVEKLGKSLENLSTLAKLEQRQTRSQEQLDGSGGSAKSNKKDASDAEKPNAKQSPPKQPPSTGVVVKETKNEKKSGRNFSFNLESVIEIKLPPSTVVQQPVISPTQTSFAPVPVPIIHEISSAGTQTMPEARSTKQQTEEPIRPILKHNTLATISNPEETIDTTRDISPVSSIASNKQKLEWDSLGDIGYDSNEKIYFCGAADLNETEKRCLQKYFAKKGLNFDEKVVVVKNVQKSESKNQEVTKDKLKTDAKLKWQAVYQKYKEKYSNPSEISMSLMNPEAQSTPKITPQQNVPPKSGKSTQTSLVKILTKAVQAEQIVTSDKQIGTESVQLAGSPAPIASGTTSVLEGNSNCEHIEVAESFEFYSSPPSQVNQSSAGSTMKSTPEVTASTPSVSSSSSTSASRKQLPAEGSKPPTYNFDDELRLGMTLYNTICESRSLPARVKQSLIDKIFSKMMKNDPKGRSKEELLMDCGKFKRSDGVSRGKEVLSGVETIGTSGSYSTVASSNRSDAAKSSIEGTVTDVPVANISLHKEAGIIHDIEEPSNRSNEIRNAASKIVRDYSESSSQQTISSRQDSSQTAKQMAPSIPTSTVKTSSAEFLETDKRIRKAMNDYLKPMTLSEVEYENQQGLKRSLEAAKTRGKIVDRDTASVPVGITSATHSERLLDFFRKEKQSQLLKIDKKIEHLKSMKLLLLEDQKVVNDIATDTRIAGPVETKPKTKPDASSEEKENIYANTGQQAKSVGSAPLYNSVQADTPSERSKDQADYYAVTRSESAWNSHYHMKQMIQNRSKLETPSSDESITTFIKTRKEKFIENYERHRRQMFEDQHHIYTKPYSGRQSKQDKHYSRLDEKYSVRKISKPIGKPNFPSSDVFISSDSMSIPAANTLTNTTTHQYDIKSSRSSSSNLDSVKPVATQTTGSILRTKPIFETKSKHSTASVQVPSAVGCQCACNCPCRHESAIEKPPKRTEIVDGTQPKQDKQQQTKPNSIAYVITFQGDHPKRKSSEKERVYRSNSIDISSSDGSNENLPSKAFETGDEEQSFLLPLKEQFERNRPGTLTRLKERQKCVNELNKLRSERNKQRKKLLLLTSDDSLKRSGVKQRLPPPPLAQRRIFSSKAIRENTRRQVKKLPEVLRKKEIEKENNLKRKNLILRDKFNRNLQRKVLHGQIDLSNSVRVIQD